MRFLFLICAALTLGFMAPSHANTFPPDMKSYDFCQSYSFTQHGLIIVPYDHGFYSTDGTKTGKGLLIQPGDTFMQFDPLRMMVGKYRFVRKNDTQAFFHERTYRYRVEKKGNGKYRLIPGQYVSSDDFYITKFRAFGWLDNLCPIIEINPGAQAWRTR